MQTLVPLPLFAGLTTAEQLRVFEPAARGYRKVVVSTNVAEVRLKGNDLYLPAHGPKASVTIDGIRYVIDSGFVKVGVGLVVIRLS